ncbi:energy-coupling factor transport system permease protein/energy-coupling factor transport system ATP-binding protein [Isoptericola jiangsuensis]|uniref:Energy-coupling factor transport system permease protein/energy-coupling factor transport system ATP-binding protein n=1 Tax=Isoptericola jiangsuensis TaxID=548579 RepID=A0A2A9F0L3_9MICO|nr:energy-coupling factor transporter transmembrane component T [Isoptericola jiangsuensis]PFG44533.1 energy-coupling factor transport system permease protein/energy-coupling factor transport system ATP-binding protein [Isoptericola jiangsuensis]
MSAATTAGTRGTPPVTPARVAATTSDGAAPRRGSLADLRTYHPLVKILGPLPVMVAVVASRDVLTPTLVAAATLGAILVMARPRGRTLAGLLAGLPALCLVMTVSFGVLTDPAQVDHTRLLVAVGPFELWSGALAVGLATALRTTALLLLVLLGGLTTTGTDLVRAFTQQLRLPYRVGWAALAALRFVPRFAHELEVIQGAHRVRGVADGRGPLAAMRRWLATVVPLLAGGIRHAERVSLAMESRGFGAHPRRTERVVVPWGARDVVLLVSIWVVGAACVVAPTLV